MTPAIRDCHPLWCVVPDASGIGHDPGAEEAASAGGLTTPPTQRLLAWHVCGFGKSPVRSPLLRARYYFLRLMRCFSSPGALQPLKEAGVLEYARTGCPIRKRWAHCVAATPPPYRGGPASFIGWSCRGILRPRIMSCLVSGLLGHPSRPNRSQRANIQKKIALDVRHPEQVCSSKHELVRCKWWTGIKQRSMSSLSTHRAC